MTARHLMVMAAGTGGHIVPGLAMAREMRSRGWTVSWLGTRSGMEQKLVPPADIPLDSLDFQGLRGKGALGMLTGGFRLLHAFWQSLHIIRARRPDVVLGMGGYVCLPGGMMASLLGKPLALVNADAALLLSNKMLQPLADRFVFGLPGDDTQRVKGALVLGNPVRPEIETMPEPAARFAGRSGPLRVLVVGGSLGAKVLNETLPAALALMQADERPVVTHQTGAAHIDGVRAEYAKLSIEAEVLPFIDDMPARLAACDVIVCRCGAITVSELCSAGVASVLVPLVISTTSHQRDNALMMERAGAAIHVPQAQLNAQTLAHQLRSLTRGKLLELAQAARRLRQEQSAKRLGDELERLAP
jgi:UDP-N-acetylglucosamine--N-acetylmuramyl-(pentapeptide) pyrophosphoryl-undecaprenol N-acetylglucosamine transferase